MPVIRTVTNRAGSEGLVIGITPKDLYMLRKHSMAQLDIRTFAMKGTLEDKILVSVLLVYGDSEEQILNVIDPNSTAYVVQENRIVLDAAPAPKKDDKPK